MLLLLVLLLLCSAHRREERKKKKDEEGRVLHCEVCTKWCARVQAVLTSPVSSPIWACWYIADIFLKVKQGRAAQKDCAVLLCLLEDSDGCCRCHRSDDGCEGHAACFCWEWKDFSRHRCTISKFLCGDVSVFIYF